MNNWFYYGLFWLYTSIHKRFSLAYLIPIPMFSVISWFLYYSTCSKSTKSMKPNWNISTEGPKVLSFIWEKVLFYKEVTCFLINNLFGKDFQTSRVIGLITLLSNCVWNSDTKKVFKLLEKVFSSLRVHRKSSLHNFRVISIF